MSSVLYNILSPHQSWSVHGTATGWHCSMYLLEIIVGHAKSNSKAF